MSGEEDFTVEILEEPVVGGDSDSEEALVAVENENEGVEDAAEGKKTVEDSDGKNSEGADEADGAEEQASDKPKRKKRRRAGDATSRINELVGRAREKENALKTTTSRLEAEAAARAKSEEVAADFARQALDARRELVELRLTAAKERGDTAEEVKYTSELAEIQSQRREVERFRSRTEQAAKQEPAKQPEQEAEAMTFEALYENGTFARRKWMEENAAWLDSSSEDYDDDKTMDVVQYAQRLNVELVNQGRGDLIDTTAYYKKINQYIKEAWGDEEMEEEDVLVQRNEKPKLVRSGGALPVSNRSPAAQKQQEKKSVTLTKSEAEFALSLPLQINGREATDEEKLRNFVKMKRITPKSGPITANVKTKF